MAFFDKLNDFAKNISEKTTDAIETGKFTSKINSEKNLAGEELKKIGEFYYNAWLESGEIAPEALDFCTAAKAHYDAAAEAQAEIDRIRAENEAAKATAAAPASAVATGAACPNCGASNAPGMKFCNNCGNKLEAPAAAVCSACGTENAPGTKFCSNCGNKLEAPANHLCPGCGAEVQPGVKFCNNCGYRLEE